MPLNALAEFFGERTRPEEVELLASGRGLYLPPDVQAEYAELASVRDAGEATANVLALKELMPGGDLFHTAVLAIFNWHPANMYPRVRDALDASVELVDALDRDQAEALLARCRTEPS